MRQTNPRVCGILLRKIFRQSRATIPLLVPYLKPFWAKTLYPDGNSTAKLESETWRDWLPLDKDGQVNLNLPAAVKLALTHSPDFQREKEDLYLSALDVTYERFRLDPKPFLDGSTKLDRSGVTGDSDGVSSIRSGLTGVAGAGTSWVASVASQLTYDLSNGATSFGGSLANLTLTQPLLARCRQTDIIVSD